MKPLTINNTELKITFLSYEDFSRSLNFNIKNDDGSIFWRLRISSYLLGIGNNNPTKNDVEESLLEDKVLLNKIKAFIEAHIDHNIEYLNNKIIYVSGPRDNIKISFLDKENN